MTLKFPFKPKHFTSSLPNDKPVNTSNLLTIPTHPSIMLQNDAIESPIKITSY